MPSHTSISASIIVHGNVQGVGFRPFIYSLAQRHHLSGFVRNAGGTVQIEVSGRQTEIESFINALSSEQPPLAVIHKIDVDIRRAADHPTNTTFTINQSINDRSGSLNIPADTATCAECLFELFDPENRRYLYPFTNCTNCGPRFTVIKGLPYDRQSTSMNCFPLCHQCNAEYINPANRRFHAQPNACWQCGPQLRFIEAQQNQDQFAWTLPTEVNEARTYGLSMIELTLNSLRAGQIVALKGLGGFHLVCDATNSEAVQRLRKRKERNAKPFAVMFPDAEELSQHCMVNNRELALLSGSRRPIVLLQQSESRLDKSVNSGTGLIGAMLPYSPLHAILLQQFKSPLVMTSANLSEEPIVTGNREARQRLQGIADTFLMHNRDIVTRFDDSVVRVFDKASIIVRRSRGYTPESIPISSQGSSARVLAFGSQLKNTFAFIQADRAYVSQHIGDMDNLETLNFFNATLDKYRQLFNLSPDAVACDMHPDYATSRLAEEFARQYDIPLIQVQHHHAHIASCMAEHGLSGKVIGVAFDGIGYGDDGSAWGGEFLITDFSSAKRVAHFSPVTMPGGTAAIKNPWRMAVSYLKPLIEQGHGPAVEIFDTLERRIGKQAVSTVQRMIQTNTNCPVTSSCGRFFDAVAALLNICDSSSFEGEAAMLLEALAFKALPLGSRHQNAYLAPNTLDTINASPILIDPHSIVGSICNQITRGYDKRLIAFSFHEVLANVIVDTCTKLANEYAIDSICLSGGVFQNRLLTELTMEGLQTREFKVYVQEKLPSNDGGLSLGQAAVAVAKLNMQV